VRVTEDAFTDWSPAWSPDGRWLYFASDRGGGRGLWRVAIEESSGRRLGEPEQVTTGSADLEGFLGFSADGRRLAYSVSRARLSLERIGLDPSEARLVGAPELLVRRSRGGINPDVSPDGQWLAHVSGYPHEDVYVSRADGTQDRQLTDDIHKDRVPRW